MKRKILSLVIIMILLFGFAIPTNAATYEKENKYIITSKKVEKENKKKAAYYDNMINEQLTEEEIAFADFVEQVKKDNPDLSPEELVDIIFAEDEVLSPNMYPMMMSKSGASSLYEDALNTWGKLTNDEKLLVVLYPTDAIKVQAAQKKTDEITIARYGDMLDGDEANAFRHALWNALMADSIGKTKAKWFADAHEAVMSGIHEGEEATDEEIESWFWNGHNGLEHRDMDYHNNAMGRDCSYWYDVFVSAETLADRVAEKIANGEAMILND